jgi:hypothetical protein
LLIQCDLALIRTSLMAGIISGGEIKYKALYELPHSGLTRAIARGYAGDANKSIFAVLGGAVSAIGFALKNML